MAQLLLFDAVDASKPPAEAGAVAGYINGRYRSLPALRQRFPGAPWLSITVTTRDQAMVLDIESGDATPESGAEWIRAMHEKGVRRPCIYASLESVPQIERAFTSLGIHRNQVRLWTAHWTGQSHICSSACRVPMIEPPGATQFRNDELRGYDVSLTSSEWVNAVRHDYLMRRP